MMGSGRYGQSWVSNRMQNLALPESPFRKVSSAELPWRPEEEEPIAAPSPPNQPTSPETADSWEKGSGCKPPEELALTLAFILNEPSSWDFTSKGQTLFAASRRVLSRAVNGYGFPQLPLLSWGLHSHVGQKEPSVKGVLTVGVAALSCPFAGCRSLCYHLPGECLQECQLHLEHNVCDGGASCL